MSHHHHSIKYEDPNELINKVIANLAVASETEQTYVSKQYHNSKNDQNEIQAYAKIAGRDWTYFVKSLNVGIGRNTDNQQQQQPPSQQSIAIDLGPSKVVSRRHAEITYDLTTRRWMLRALGRNGLKVDGLRVSNPGSNSDAILLESGSIIDIGGTQMMFILPDAAPNIAAPFLENLKDINNNNKNNNNNNNKNGSLASSSYGNSILDNNGLGPNSTTTTTASASVSGQGSFKNHPSSINSNLKGFQIFNKSQINDGESHSSSPGSKIGEQDLSKDESKDIKPPYSYATMITQAILTNPEGILSLSEIYDWISSHYAYYRHSKTDWQNSIRHNLSLNKAFDKVPRKPNEPGKGMKWCIAPAYKNEFMKKWESGSMKPRRGSSVTRQLQIHLMKNKKLPDDASHKYNNTLKANPQLPQIRNVESMQTPPFMQAYQSQQHPIQRQQQARYPNNENNGNGNTYLQQQPRPFLQPPAPLNDPQQQQQQQQQQFHANFYSLPIYQNGGPINTNHNNNGSGSTATVTMNKYQTNGGGGRDQQHNMLATPSRGGHSMVAQQQQQQYGGPVPSVSTSHLPPTTDPKLANGLSSPQAPLSAERGVSRGNGGGFGDFVYSSPTKENT